MYDRILVPTDGSTDCEPAVEYALELAETHDAGVRTVYVVNAANYGGLPMESAWDGVGDVLREEGAGAVERVIELAEQCAPGVPVDTRVVEGSPSRAIVEEASESDCDLVVMGTHGRGGIDRLLLGSVTERVVRSSPVPVLTVQVGEADREDDAATADPQAVVD